MIKLQTTEGKVYEGEVYAIDPVSKSIALKTETSYIVVNPSQISLITGELTSVKAPPLSELGLSISGIEKREMTAYKNAEKCIDAINNKVNSNIQDLYYRISLLFPSCKWDDVSIVIFDDYIIQPPYEEVIFRSGNGNQNKEFLDRVAKILDAERKKLNL